MSMNHDDVHQSTDALAKWRDWYLHNSKDAGLAWPNETLIRIFKAPYIPGLGKDFAGRKLLDVGFGHGNNLVFLASLGLKLYGTEVTEEICKTVGARLAPMGLAPDLRVGFNRKLPFGDDEFDFLVSWNTLHYESTEDAIKASILEYRRVLKPGGRFFISTTGPEHKILKGAKTLGAHRYEIGRDDDFRKGETFFYFDAPNYIHHYFDPVFSDVLVGRTHDFLFTDTLDWYVITGVKGTK